MLDLNRYWHATIAGIRKSLSRPADDLQRQAILEREVQALSSVQDTFARKLELLRAEFEQRVRDAADGLEALEQARRVDETARAAVLAELEQRLTACERERDAASGRIKVLEDALAETTRRLDTRDNQLKFLQDAAREQLQLQKTALAETASRLESRDNQRGVQLDALHGEIVALTASVADSDVRQDSTDGALGQLREALAEQARRVASHHTATAAGIEATGQLVRTLEKQLRTECDNRQITEAELQAELRAQSVRLGRMRLVALLALALVVLSAVIQITR